jgi:membrane-associated HD superfamily phosphohydrolase
MTDLNSTGKNNFKYSLLAMSISIALGIFTSLMVSFCMVGRSTSNYGYLVLSSLMLIASLIIAFYVMFSFKDYTQIITSNIGTGIISGLILSSFDPENRVFFISVLGFFL